MLSWADAVSMISEAFHSPTLYLVLSYMAVKNRTARCFIFRACWGGLDGCFMVIWAQIDNFFPKPPPVENSTLGVRYSTSLLAISANRLARRPLAKTTDGRREAAPRCFVDEGGVLLSDLR